MKVVKKADILATGRIGIHAFEFASNPWPAFFLNDFFLSLNINLQHTFLNHRCQLRDCCLSAEIQHVSFPSSRHIF